MNCPVLQNRPPRRRSLVLCFLFAACATDRIEAESDEARPEISPEPVIVRFDERHQAITGFGASSAWTAPNMSAELADQFFTVERGIGLTLLRLQVKPFGDTTEVDTARLAVARGARLWAAPWSPPGDWKTNGALNNGGSLLPEHYDDWANSLADFAQRMTERSLPLTMLSAQNEPDYVAEWDTCEWTPGALATFVGDHLGPALRSRGLDTPVLAPESANWNSFARYADAIIEHPAAGDYVGALATHSYAGAPFPHSGLEQGWEAWQTEVSDPGSSGSEMDSGLRVARMIHEHLAIGNVSAWHYWWLIPRLDEDTGNSALTNMEVELTRRAYVLGNYSKFVRPGFVRVETNDTRNTGVYATAFVEPDTGRFALVAVNERHNAIEQVFELRGATANEAVAWVTSAANALEEAASAPFDDGVLEIELTPRSVTTFVGTLDPAPRDAG